MTLFEKIKGKQVPPAPEKTLLQLRQDVTAAENTLIARLLPECRRLFSMKDPPEEELTAFYASFWGLSPRIAGAVGYEMGKMGLSRGSSGFHGGWGRPLEMLPVTFFDWAGFQPWGGIAFQIHRSCFSSPNPRLYFTADSRPYLAKKMYAPEEHTDYAAAIREYSHMITDVTVKLLEEEHRCRIEFSLAPEEKKPLISMTVQGGDIPSRLITDPVIQIPIVGEFFCVFGEVTPEGDVPLHRDDFCMK